VIGAWSRARPCIGREYLEAFEEVGAHIQQPWCGPARTAARSFARSEQVTVSAIDRNFRGRSGPGQVWLTSLPTVASSAISGYLTSFEALAAGATA
jgi:3-isopropylmalate/(R)-2-methylmalate dehydratase large subunit